MWVGTFSQSLLPGTTRKFSAGISITIPVITRRGTIVCERNNDNEMYENNEILEYLIQFVPSSLRKSVPDARSNRHYVVRWPLLTHHPREW